MASDKLRGSVAKYKQPSMGSFGATGGPWRGPATDHKAQAHGGHTPSGKGDAAKNVRSVEKHQGGRTGREHRFFATPHSTHLPDAAVRQPKWSTRDAVAEKSAPRKPVHKKRSKTISAR